MSASPNRPCPYPGEPSVTLSCLVNGVHVTCHFQNIQYIPGLTHGLLSCKALDHHRLHIRFGNGMCKIIHCDGTIVTESLKDPGHLYYLHTTPDLPQTPDPTAALTMTAPFDLLHK